MNYTLADGKMTDAATAGSVNIAKAGTYTITVKVGENSDLTYSIVLATRQLQSQRQAIPLHVLWDGNTLLAVMSKVSDGVYTCKYKPTAWENFYFIYVGENKDDKQTWYGCEPGMENCLNCYRKFSYRSWNLWFKMM